MDAAWPLIHHKERDTVLAVFACYRPEDRLARNIAA